jgi:uncharacterized protein
MTDTATRYRSLDAIRGFAVMGILLMNIVGFAMPESAYITPAAYGSEGPADYATWAATFILIDGKMRGLFSMLFGASMLLVYERAEAKDGTGRQTHLRRMLVLLLFGALHYYLIWFGDILILYALCGLIGVWLLRLDADRLRKWMIGLFMLGFVIMAGTAVGLFAMQYAATQPGADAELVTSYREMMTQFGADGPAAFAGEVARYQGSWWGIVHSQLTDGLFDPLILFAQSAAETLGLMALGMILFRNGFLTGGWTRERYTSFMIRAYAIGIPPTCALAAWNWASGFDPVVSLSSFIAWSMPFRIAVMLGHAALLMLVIDTFIDRPALARVEAAGKAAFTNYLGTSILMTGIFYGWGLGLYGDLSRWQVYLFVPVAWAIMLLWSKPWLDRYRYGPLEWLWRSLSRGQMQSMRK